MVGAKTFEDAHFSVAFPSLKSRFPIGKGTLFYLNAIQGDLSACVLLGSEGLHSSILTSIYSMKVSYIKHLPCIIFGNRNEEKNGCEYEEISFLKEEEEWMCFVYSGFRKFLSLTKVNSSKMAMHCVDEVAFLRMFSMSCISHFCFMKIKEMSRFYFTVSRGQYLVVFTKKHEN